MHSENSNTPANNNTGKTATGLGTKARGVAEVIHGGVENVRGTTLGAANTVVGRSAAVLKNDQLAQQGRLETDRGLAKVKGNVEPPAQGLHTGYPPGQPSDQHQGGHIPPGQLRTAGQGHIDLPQDPQNTGRFPPTQYYGTGQIPPASHQPAVERPGPTHGPHAQLAEPGVDDAVPPGQAGAQMRDEHACADRSAQLPADPSAGTASSGGGTGPQTMYPSHPHPHQHHRDDGISGIPPHELKDIQAHHANHPTASHQDPTPGGRTNQNVQPPAGGMTPTQGLGPETTYAAGRSGDEGIPKDDTRRAAESEPKVDPRPSREDHGAGEHHGATPVPAN